MDDKFLDKKYVRLPSGKRDNDSEEEDDKNWIPRNLRSDVRVQYTFGDTARTAHLRTWQTRCISLKTNTQLTSFSAIDSEI